MTLTLFVPGTPGAKGRPRFSRASGRAFTPAATVKYENYLKSEMAAAMREQDRDLLQNPVEMRLVFQMPEPKSMRKRDKGLGLPHTKRPDLDNLMKAVLDAANEVVVRDDSLIFGIHAEKRYSENPGVRIEFFEREQS